MNARRNYLPHIDGLRAIAVLAVIVFHMNPHLLPGGFVGVDIFFVISGYVVSRSVSHLGPVSLWNFVTEFYARRMIRIAPALCVCLLVTTLATVFFVPYAWLSATTQRTGMAAFFGLSNFVLADTAGDYFAPRAELNTFTHTWSLGVEEQYYLVFPFLFILWLRHRSSLSTGLVAALAAISLVLAILTTPTQPDRAFFLIFYRFWELAAGALLFQLFEERPVSTGARAGAILSLAAVAVALFVVAPRSTPFPGAILPVFGTVGALLFLRTLPPSQWLPRLLSHPVPAYIGRISFSLYLWHWPIFVLFRWTVGLEPLLHTAVALALTFGAAALSYRLVETPPRRAPYVAALPRIAVIGIGAVAVAASWGTASAMWATRATISLSVVNRNTLDWHGDGIVKPLGDCRVVTQRIALPGWTGRSITRTGCDLPATSARRVFVIGDSHASAYDVMLRQLVMSTGATVELHAAGGCGVLSLFHQETSACRAFRDAAVARVLSMAAPGDVLFLPALRLPRLAEQFSLSDEAAALASVGSPAIAALRLQQAADFAPVLASLAARQAVVVLEAPKPVFRAPAFRCMDWFNRANPICIGGTTIPRATIDQLRAPMLEVFSRLAGPNLRIWDPLPILCPEAECSLLRGDRPLFFDADHLSGFGNAVLAPSFEGLLAELRQKRE